MSKIAARRKIKKHLRRKGEDWIEVTPDIVMYWWRVLNEAIFNDELRPPKKIVCRNFQNGDLGFCQTGRRNRSKKDPVFLGIRRELEDRNMFIEVVAHEMVHQHQQQTTGRMSHGLTHFYSWADTIQRTIGLPLREKIDY